MRMINCSLRYVFVVLAQVVILSGCVTVQNNYVPRRTEISEPPIDSINIASVGDSMLRQGKYALHDAILVLSDVEVGAMGAYTIKGGYYLKQGDDFESEFFQPSIYGRPGAIIRGALADPPRAVQLVTADNSLCVVTIFNASICADGANFERTEQSIISSDSFQQTLIYSGRVGDKIKVGYREYSNNMARPVFNNDVEYDLKESSVIGYKGARIEVLEATNEYIKYKVIRNFNKATY